MNERTQKSMNDELQKVRKNKQMKDKKKKKEKREKSKRRKKLNKDRLLVRAEVLMEDPCKDGAA